MTNADSSFEELCNTQTLIGLPADEAVNKSALLADLASYNKSEAGSKHALSLINELLSSAVYSSHYALLHYQASNVYYDLYAIHHAQSDSKWLWKIPELEESLIHLRKCVVANGFNNFPTDWQFKIYTNLGNTYSTIGRPLDAITLYNKAITDTFSFGMAMINNGIALMYLADSHYDNSQAAFLLYFAYHFFRNAPSSHLEPGVDHAIAAHIESIEKKLTREFLDSDLQLYCNQYSLGATTEETNYRKWVLREQLFLNLLNSLGSYPIAARDMLGLPNLTVQHDEGPGLPAMFSQIKQEFVSARFLAWEGISSTEPHYSDRDTVIIETYDQAVYGLSVEKIKIAFRISYSLLDKCSYLLNKYLKLGIPDNRISFSNVWFINGVKNKGFNSNIFDSQNTSFRGLYWLSRDLFDADFTKEALEPDAKELHSIRNHLEHKYLKTHSILPTTNAGFPGMKDQHAYSITKDSLVTKTITLLRIARSAITYLSLGIHAEETKKRETNSSQGYIPALRLGIVPDDAKQ